MVTYWWGMPRPYICIRTVLHCNWASAAVAQSLWPRQALPVVVTVPEDGPFGKLKNSELLPQTTLPCNVYMLAGWLGPEKVIW